VYEARKSTFTKRVSIVVRRTIGSKFSKCREKKDFLFEMENRERQKLRFVHSEKYLYLPNLFVKYKPKIFTILRLSARDKHNVVINQ